MGVTTVDLTPNPPHQRSSPSRTSSPRPSRHQKAKNDQTCDECGGQTTGGPCIRDELWSTITRTIAVPIPCPPGEPFLFPLFRSVDTFLCFGCIEQRLGRPLVQEDLDICQWNAGWIDPPSDYALPFQSLDSAQASWAGWAHGRPLLPHSEGRK